MLDYIRRELRSIDKRSNKNKRIEKGLGGYNREGPPLTIPNREVKLTRADGTAVMWESRFPPFFLTRDNDKDCSSFFFTRRRRRRRREKLMDTC